MKSIKLVALMALLCGLGDRLDAVCYVYNHPFKCLVSLAKDRLNSLKDAFVKGQQQYGELGLYVNKKNVDNQIDVSGNIHKDEDSSQPNSNQLDNQELEGTKSTDVIKNNIFTIKNGFLATGVIGGTIYLVKKYDVLGKTKNMFNSARTKVASMFQKKETIKI